MAGPHPRREHAGYTGALAPGNIADLILVEGNPAADIRSTRNVRLVIQEGRIRSMDSLLAQTPPVREVGGVAAQQP